MLADLIDIGDNVLSVHVDHFVRVRTKSSMQDSTILCDVQLDTAHHSVLD